MGIDTRNVKDICPSCFADLNADGICTQCKLSAKATVNPPESLPVYTMLNGRYTVGKQLGSGGFGITYVGRDMGRSRKVVIKEFYPRGFAVRENGGIRVNVKNPDSVTSYNHWFNGFISEAKILMQIKDLHGVVKLLDFFEANGTAYIITDFLNGKSLYAYLCAHGYRLSCEQSLNILRPVLQSLAVLHEHGVIHKDISPENILIVDDKYVKLIDFGAAQLYKLKTTEKPYSVLKTGYSPIEMYKPSSYEQGPWSDVYQIAATLYNCITGYVPQAADERIAQDKLPAPSSLGFKMERKAEKALMKALAVLPAERYRTVKEFADALGVKL